MGWVEDARSALDGVQDQPARSLARAEAILADDACPAAARVLARWAVGRARQELGEPARAVDELRAAAAAADDLGDHETRGHIDMSLAWATMAVGDSTGALAALDRADATLRGAANARVRMQRGLLHFQLGQLDDAVTAFDAALPVLRRADDNVAVARLLVNRAAAATAMGRWAGARADLVEAAEAARREGLGLVAAGAEHNLGFLAGRQGEVPRALVHFSRAAQAYASLDGAGRLMAVLAVDRCEVLLAAGLTGEARAEAAEAVVGFEQAGATADADEARLLLARAELAAGDAPAARVTAARCEAGFVATNRPAWAALAGYTALVAEVTATEDTALPPADLPERVQSIVEKLEAAGWSTEAAHARTFLGRTALALGRGDLARAALARRRLPATASAALQVQVWHGRALLHAASGDRAGAVRAVRRGLRVVDLHRHTLGATELRAGASALGIELARLGMRLALATGQPARVMAAAELHRAASLRAPVVRPPADAALGTALSDLRAAESDRRAALLAGGSGADEERRVRTAERAVQDISRQQAGGGDDQFVPPSVTSLRAALGDRTLVAYVSVDRHLHAVVIGPGSTRLVDLGDATTAETERNHLLSALRRGLASLLRGDGGGARFLDAIDQSTARLDLLLVAPLQIPSAVAGSAPDVVVVPTTFGHALPWGSLPSFHGRGVTVAPSAALWLRGRRTASGPRRAPLLVAGPHLDGAEAELDAIAAVWPGAQRLDGSAATVDAVLESLGSSDLLHVAAHGLFRADSPLFSTLRLADGVLTVYDIEGLSRVPSTVVLPACSAAAVDVRAGDELLGTTAALLGAGVTTVVAPVVAIPDRTAATFTVALHERLRAGTPVARAAADAAMMLRGLGDPLSVLTATSFVCVGADERTGPAPDAAIVSARSRG